ncbi:MAG: FAD/NAD(P)-binding protein [Kiritimatiellae bacterium]|nr:FAD/NAD(P)-binding protein [Kiritimatiellia bacterium]
MDNNPYIPVPAKLVDVVEETHNIKTFVVEPVRPIVFEAGQFVEMTVPGYGEAPFTPSSSPAVSDRMEITVMRVGQVTERLHALGPGAELGIRGPLGAPYPLDTFCGREILIVGGGVGLAPLRALLFGLLEHVDRYHRIVLRYGARTPSDIIYRDAVSSGWGQNGKLDVRVCVDEGDADWKGNTGVVTTILEPECLSCDPANGVAVVCGPPIMMKFATLKLLDLGYAPADIYLSMEKNMSCGVGKCGHCRLGRYYACKDGPVFTYDAIESINKIWD